MIPRKKQKATTSSNFFNVRNVCLGLFPFCHEFSRGNEIEDDCKSEIVVLGARETELIGRRECSRKTASRSVSNLPSAMLSCQQVDDKSISLSGRTSVLTCIDRSCCKFCKKIFIRLFFHLQSLSKIKFF